MTQLGYVIGCIGVWVLADGISSLWAYTAPDRSSNQSWIRDHSLRLLRCALGIVLIYAGWRLLTNEG